MISYGGDTDDNANPIELRMDKFVDLDLSDEVIGITALRRIQVEGPKRHQLGIVLEGHKEQTGHAIWYDVFKDGQRVGSMTNGGFSPRMGKFIGYVLVARDVKIGDNVVVHKMVLRSQVHSANYRSFEHKIAGISQ